MQKKIKRFQRLATVRKKDVSKEINNSNLVQNEITKNESLIDQINTIMESSKNNSSTKIINSGFFKNNAQLLTTLQSQKEIASNRIEAREELQLGKIKYNDKILHQSKIIKLYVDNEDDKKIQKEINKVFKKISKNKKYFYSAKDLALVHALIKDGFDIPSNFNYKEKSAKYDVPTSLLQLVEKKQNAFLALKIIEIMGEDEPYQLDPETIFFITSLLNEMNLIKIRNKVLISALPERV